MVATSEIDGFLVKTHSRLTVKEQAKELGVPRYKIGLARQKLYEAGRISPYKRAYHRRWSPGEVEFLEDHYSTNTTDSLCKRLRRSKTAILLKKRRLGIRRTDGIYTARTLAEIFGVDSKFFPNLVAEGFLSGKRAPWRQGPYPPWVFDEAEVIRFIQSYPWMLDLNRMDGHYFRSILCEEWERDPWYSNPEAARIIGYHPHSIANAAREGRLRGYQRSPKKRWSYWRFRRSDLRRFGGHTEVQPSRLPYKRAAKLCLSGRVACPTEYH